MIHFYPTIKWIICILAICQNRHKRMDYMKFYFSYSFPILETAQFTSRSTYYRLLNIFHQTSSASTKANFAMELVGIVTSTATSSNIVDLVLEPETPIQSIHPSSLHGVWHTIIFFSNSFQNVLVSQGAGLPGILKGNVSRYHRYCLKCTMLGRSYLYAWDPSMVSSNGHYIPGNTTEYCFKFRHCTLWIYTREIMTEICINHRHHLHILLHLVQSIFFHFACNNHNYQ